MIRSSGATAADKLNDFQPVAFPKGRLRPLVARDDLAVQFNCNAILLHAQLLYQGGKRQGGCEIAAFAIDLKFHLTWIFAVRGMLWQAGKKSAFDLT